MGGETAPAGTVRRLVVDIDQCTGCKACAVACSYVKTGVYDADAGCIFVAMLEEYGMDCPVFCQQCTDPRCVEACSFNAMTKRPSDGLVMVDQSRCTACGVCLTACPYGAISPAQPGRTRGTVIMKCDLCGGSPECVQWCDTHALKFIDAADKKAVDAAGEDMLLAKKRYEMEYDCKLWRLRLRGHKLKELRPGALK